MMQIPRPLPGPTKSVSGSGVQQSACARMSVCVCSCVLKSSVDVSDACSCLRSTGLSGLFRGLGSHLLLLRNLRGGRVFL